jgi:signal transduction histidine kinase/CheY-like chemotaxis protein
MANFARSGLGLKTLVLNFVIVVAYFGLGLSGLWVDPSGSLMLSSGLAVVAVLLLGTSSLPGVITGALLVSAWRYGFKQELVSVYVAAAVGAAWAAYLGARLINRIVGFPNPLTDVKSIVGFMVLAGPISHLLQAILNNIVLRHLTIQGLITNPGLWLNEWVGNILGVLICSPIMLILFGQPRPVWAKRRFSVGLPILLTFALVILLFLYLRAVERTIYTEQLKSKAVTFSQVIKNRLDLDLYSVSGLRNFLLGFPMPASADFKSLTRDTLVPIPEIQMLTAITLPESDNGKNWDIDTVYERAYLKPEIQRLVLPWLRTKIEQKPLFTQPEIYVPETDRLYLFVPAINHVSNHAETMPVLIAAVAVDVLVKQALEVINGSNDCLVRITHPQADVKNSKLIFGDRLATDRLDKPYFIIPISVLGQTWEVNFYHDWGLLARSQVTNRYFGWVIFFGFCFTGLMGLVLLHLTGRYFRNEAIIEERTQLLMNAKAVAESANQAKNHFLAKISHELRTPLNGISGFTQLLERKASIVDEDRKHITIIKQCSENLLKLINDILDISTIESKQTRIKIEDFNFVELLDECVNLCRISAEEKGLSLIVNSKVPDYLLGDEKRIRQILLNLLDNAVKYTKRGRVTVNANYQVGNLVVTVADTGSGISPKDLETVFTPFVQISADNFSHDGTGLGLAICQELVTLMGGELTVRSYLGEGSTFTFNLPLAQSPIDHLSPGVKPVLNKTDISQLDILVVDDNEINLLFLNGLLEQIGCNADSAKDGLEALGLTANKNYDVALIDINMPIMNGLELASRLRKQNYQSRLVAVSAYSDHDKFNEAFAAGFDTYLTKPIEESRLVDLLHFCLRENN